MDITPHTHSPLCQAVNRRHFLRDGVLGLGSMALATLLNRDVAGEPNVPAANANPLHARPGHFPAKAKSVIFLFMAGGPSQFDLFDPKPELNRRNGQTVPRSLLSQLRFAFIRPDATLLGSSRRFSRAGRVGAPISELIPYHRDIVDDICFVKGMKTDVFNHAPAKTLVNTGSPQFGRPSMGAWVTYGIGSESENLPAFVVLQSGNRGPRGGAALWSSGFLPSLYQGVPFLKGRDPIYDLQTPPGVNPQQQRNFFDAVRQLNQEHEGNVGDPEIATRIASYETAFRMQGAAPEAIDLASETPETLRLYGSDPRTPSFANNCILARRLVERGVRFVQLYHTDWDHHGDGDTNLGQPLIDRCREVDQASAALIKDLKRRGMLEDTLVIWGGEFGRTPMGEFRNYVGRDHYIDAYTMWLAGGGIKSGYIHGKTDELGLQVEEGAMHVHDLQATILHLLGLDHTRLTFRFQGRDYRLTDVEGHVVPEILA